MASPPGSPEGYATPDDQGTLALCTRYALAKAVANGFIDKNFVKDLELDFDQNALSLILVNEFQVILNLVKYESNGHSYPYLSMFRIVIGNGQLSSMAKLTNYKIVRQRAGGKSL